MAELTAGRRPAPAPPCFARRWPKPTIAVSTPNSRNWSNCSARIACRRHSRPKGACSRIWAGCWTAAERRSQQAHPIGKGTDPRIHQAGQSIIKSKKNSKAKRPAMPRSKTRRRTRKAGWQDRQVGPRHSEKRRGQIRHPCRRKQRREEDGEKRTLAKRIRQKARR